MTTKVRKRPQAKVSPVTEAIEAPEDSGPLPGSDVVVQERRPRPGNSKYDWESIRRDFIEGIDRVDSKNEKMFPNLRELSEMHEIPYERVRKKSAEERWTNKRASAEAVYHQKRAAGRAAQVARNALDFDEKTYNAAKIGLAMVTTRFAEIAQEVGLKKPVRDAAWQAYSQGQPYDKPDLYSAIRADELQSLANAAERLQTLGMKALGTDVQRVDLTGAGSTNVNILNVTQEVQRDDPERLAAIIGAMGEAGMLPGELLDVFEGEAEDTVEAEVVDVPDDGNEYFTDDLIGEEEEIDTDALAAEVLGD